MQLIELFQNGVDACFFGLSLSICAWFDSLRKSFDGDKKKFVVRHQLIIESVEELNHLMKPVVFSQFFISSLLLCVIWFQLFVNLSLASFIINFVYGFAICLQLFFFAYGGQQIIEKSSTVADDFFESDSDLIIIIARAHKPAKITSAFYTATLPTFTSVISSSTSLMALWKSFID